MDIAVIIIILMGVSYIITCTIMYYTYNGKIKGQKDKIQSLKERNQKIYDSRVYELGNTLPLPDKLIVVAKSTDDAILRIDFLSHCLGRGVPLWDEASLSEEISEGIIHCKIPIISKKFRVGIESAQPLAKTINIEIKLFLSYVDKTSYEHLETTKLSYDIETSVASEKDNV